MSCESGSWCKQWGLARVAVVCRVPKVSLAAARAAHDAAHSMIKQGIHPAHERRNVKLR
ncbi:integrase arm-type DNA-binding domain-containing protein [Burkholderia sp. Bp8963]|uniref:integrase arm-type DNA-binding domain-containing protein n=1 Tax=Burkholderia sp. Bp8963 TaxID=2184547 RepID=UPI0039083234